MKKILLVDDSALMRRVLSAIINGTNEYTVAYIAKNGAEGLEIIEKHDDIFIVLSDVNMPVMTGLELLSTMRRKNIMLPLILLSTKDEAAYTIAALELGALGFIKKPDNIYKLEDDSFANELIGVIKSAENSGTNSSLNVNNIKSARDRNLNENVLAKHEAIRIKGNVNVHNHDGNQPVHVEAVINQEEKPVEPVKHVKPEKPVEKVKPIGLSRFADLIKPVENKTAEEKTTDKAEFSVNINKALNNSRKAATSKKLIALVSSTGGPKALRTMIPMLPKNLDAPIVMVQHMPANFTTTLAERLEELSEVKVSEVAGGEYIEKGHVYLCQGGKHLKVDKDSNGHFLVLDDSPPVVGLKPCGNIMYDSLVNCDYDEIVCVVLTGMGADGTKGIVNLSKHKKIYVIAQDEASSTVYGMPRAIYEKGMCDVVCDINNIAKEIVKKVGVR